MEIKEFISKVLQDMEDLKQSNAKKSYVVEELEFELGIVINNQEGADSKLSINVFGFSAATGFDGGSSKENIQKVKIKLKPKKLGNGRTQANTNT